MPFCGAVPSPRTPQVTSPCAPWQATHDAGGGPCHSLQQWSGRLHLVVTSVSLPSTQHSGDVTVLSCLRTATTVSLPISVQSGRCVNCSHSSLLSLPSWPRSSGLAPLEGRPGRHSAPQTRARWPELQVGRGGARLMVSSMSGRPGQSSPKPSCPGGMLSAAVGQPARVSHRQPLKEGPGRPCPPTQAPLEVTPWTGLGSGCQPGAPRERGSAAGHPHTHRKGCMAGVGGPQRTALCPSVVPPLSLMSSAWGAGASVGPGLGR